MEWSILQLTRVVNWGIVLTAEANEGTDSQFPFLAAVILVAIIMIVSIGDMIKVNKEKEEAERKEREEEKDSNI